METKDRAGALRGGERRLRTQDAGRGAEGDDAGAPGQELTGDRFLPGVRTMRDQP